MKYRNTESSRPYSEQIPHGSSAERHVHVALTHDDGTLAASGWCVLKPEPRATSMKPHCELLEGGAGI